MKKTIRRFAALLLALSFSSLSASAETLTIGLIPSEDAQAMLKNSKAVMDSIQTQTGMTVRPFIATDYNGIIEALRAKKLDVAYLGPFSYVLASSIANVEAFAVAETKKTGKSSYKSLIIVRKDSNLKDLNQLKDHTMAFVDPTSTSGHLFPAAGLQKNGIDPNKFFSRVIFSGSHDASILAVANKKVDAAAVADRIYFAAIASGTVKESDFNIVWTSPDIPESPMVWRKDLSPELKVKIAAAFANVKNLEWGDQGVLNGFQKTNDAAYNPVRETAQILNLNLKTMK
ncbi:phosphonate ABC transporter substrate-binding protein [Undibacterium sp. Dicai25W]|uniref:phosphonate ABC transporter substrate-binding protein n=1 Tax=Undibacterium sp. Dicai25W TaxID=3413034 RepID=UPI003BF3E706